MEVDLLVRGGTVVTVDDAGSVIDDGVVAVRQGTIVHVGPSTVASHFQAKTVIDAAGQVVTPGLVDAHNHPIHSLSKGLADDLELSRRSFERIWPYELALTDAEAELAATATFLEMISTGTTCFADPGSYYPDATARAALAVGIRGIVAREICDLAPDGAPPQIVEDPAKAVADASRVVKDWNNTGEGRIRAMFSVVRPTTVSDDLCTLVRKASERAGVGVHGHLLTGGHSEEASSRVAGTGGVVGRYERLGLLDGPLVLAHLGPLTPAERETLRTHSVTAVHCPSASMLGGFGVIAHGSIPELIADGVAVGLGSDAGAISRFLDMVRIAYLAACGHKDARRDPEVMGSDAAFRMATIDGARALGWADCVGSIEVGKSADLVVFDTSGPEWHPNPLARPVANLVYSASGRSARDVIIAGNVIMRDREVLGIDVEAVMHRSDLAARGIRSRLGFDSP
jgi:5-methylthioadenosine/S-adenosylhomocysteine deaminase